MSLDRLINKFISRKLFVTILATVLLCLGIIDPILWASIAGIYIGIEGALDYKSLKGE